MTTAPRSIAHIIRHMVGLSRNSRVPIIVCIGSNSPMLSGGDCLIKTITVGSDFILRMKVRQ